MKCIQCGTDSNLKDRLNNQGRCKNCNHPFVFEPTAMQNIKITDLFFAKAIDKISVNQSLFFTENQLHYFINKIYWNQPEYKVSVSLCVLIFFGCNIFGFFLAFSSFQTVSAFNFLIILFILNLSLIFLLYLGSKSKISSSVSRKTFAKSLVIIGILILGAGIYASVVFNTFPGFLSASFLGLLSLYLGQRQKSRQPDIKQEFIVTKEPLRRWLLRWQQVNGSVSKLLPPPRRSPQLAPVSPDVTAYSFDRLVVCDSEQIAHFLIANNFHFENNCAVLSINGYPESVFATAMQMLRRNPDLKVYAFHHCSPQGVGLVHTLRTSSTWFRDSSVTIVDIGLLPRQILASRRSFFIQESTYSASLSKKLPSEVRQSLTGEELAWLDAGNWVKLESFSPQKLLNILNRGIAKSQELDSGEIASSSLDDDTSFYVIQNFG